MKVMFGYNADCDRITDVYWATPEGVDCRSIRDDGSFKEEQLGYATLREAYKSLYGSFNPFYVTEVDDVRAAFKYLGKASDLVETLPEASLDDEQPAG